MILNKSQISDRFKLCENISHQTQYNPCVVSLIHLAIKSIYLYFSHQIRKTFFFHEETFDSLDNHRKDVMSFTNFYHRHYRTGYDLSQQIITAAGLPFCNSF